MLADIVLGRHGKSGAETEFWWREEAREPEREGVQASRRPSSVPWREREAARLFLSVEARPLPHARRLCARGRS